METAIFGAVAGIVVGAAGTMFTEQPWKCIVLIGALAVAHVLLK